MGSSSLFNGWGNWDTERVNKLDKATQLSDSSQDANLLQGYLAPDSALFNHYTASWQTLLGKRICIKIYFQIQFAYDLFKIFVLPFYVYY